MDGNRIGPQLDGFLHGAYKGFGSRVRGHLGAPGEVNDQANVLSALPVAGPNQSFMDDNGIRAPYGHRIDGRVHIDQPLNGPDRHPVIHRDDHRLARISVHDTLYPNFLSHHGLFPPFFEIKKAVRKFFFTALK